MNTYFADKEVANIYAEFKSEIIDYFGPKERNKRRQVRVQNLGISDNDLWIAALAIRYNLIVVSADRDFQRMQEVRSFALECWRINP